jgi:hypothetical protein
MSASHTHPSPLSPPSSPSATDMAHHPPPLIHRPFICYSLTYINPPHYKPWVLIYFLLPSHIQMFLRVFLRVCRMRRSSVRVRRSSVGCGVAQLGCGVAQLVTRRLAVRQARCQFSARHPELTGDEEIERNLGYCRQMNVLYECDQNKQKE